MNKFSEEELVIPECKYECKDTICIGTFLETFYINSLIGFVIFCRPWSYCRCTVSIFKE